MRDPHSHLTLPDYSGGSIVNVAASVLHAFDVEAPSPPLHAELLGPEGLAGPGGTVLLVLDALGLSQLETALAAGVVPRLAQLIDSAPQGLQSLTSIFPSTTTAALSSLATACPPAEHGVLGHLLWFEEVDTVVNMLTLHPLNKPVPIPESMVRLVPTIYQRLAARGVRSTLITDSTFEGMPFTNLLAEGARFAGYGGLSQIPYQLEQMLQQAQRPGFYSLYWPLIDTLAHLHGPDHAETPSLACRMEMEFVDLMVSKVAELCARDRCTLVIIADHGQTSLTQDRATPLPQDICTALRRPPGGTRRALYLSGIDVERLSADSILADAVAISTKDAVAANWFGGALDQRLCSRIGDVILLAGEGSQFLYDYGRGTHTYAGAHSGMTRNEMQVPLIIVPGI